MTVEQIRKLHADRPFRPFVMRTADGRESSVRHPEMKMFSPSGRTIAVATTDDAFDILDLLLMASVNVGGNAAAAGSTAAGPDTASRSS